MVDYSNMHHKRAAIDFDELETTNDADNRKDKEAAKRRIDTASMLLKQTMNLLDCKESEILDKHEWKKALSALAILRDSLG